MEPQPFVRFAGVEKTYDGRALAVAGLDLAIRRGEFLTLLGPSGSGKTTTLMMLAGFETPTAGEISVDGRSLAAVPPHRRNFGMVFQSYALFPHLTVAENLAFPLQMRRLGRAEVGERVDRALAMVRLSGYGDRRPRQLSGGQQQRVALARALVFEPTLVLMDEPLGALDKQLREQMQLEIRHIHASLGVTFVYVTHDQGEALTMSDRIAVFQAGRLSQLDTPHALYESPANAFVAGFVGETNRFEASVERVEGGRASVRLADGTALQARAVDLGGGGRALLAVRPERVRLPAGPDDENRLEALLLEHIYYGDHSRLRLAVAGNDDFMVKLPRAADAAALTAGSRLAVSFRAEHCHAFAAT